MKRLQILCAILWIQPTLSFISRGQLLHSKLPNQAALSSVKRRPDRFTEWEVRKKEDSNQQRQPGSGGISSIASKAASYRNSIADSIRIADSTSLVNRRTKISQVPNVPANITEIPNSETGLVIERLGGSLLVEVSSKDNSSRYDVICYQRSSLTDSVIVVGDYVDLLVVARSDAKADVDADQVGDLGGELYETEQSAVGVLDDNLSATATAVVDHEAVLEDSMTDREQPLGDAPVLPLQGVVLRHHDRTNLLQRPSPFNSGTGAKNKAIAANIDQIILVVSAVPIVPLSSIDRILVAAHEYNMEAIILLNKIDLEGSEELFERLGRYSAIGYPVLKVSVRTEEGLEELREKLQNKCSVFVGQSGIGKSSLVNTLLPDADFKAKIGALVRSANLGAHTTSSARLFHLPEGGTIIDSPGIRELGLWHLSEASIKAGFREIDSLTHNCKFRNCKHTAATLGCAVQEGVRNGIVHPDRLESYFTFLE
jgi:ribosome small subunit-dependent GTPase A